ncbi:MAG TPA: nucleotidyltransferase domain-containing protein [Methanospirillum sp.]|nr:nucleotidyltransferase domain-containing protein [Methanospirillum sp.]
MAFSPDTELQRIQTFVLSYLQDEPVTVILFGSRARGTAHRGSDVDIGLIPHGEVNSKTLTLLREGLEEFATPWIIELVDISKTDESFRSHAMREGIIWKE